MVGKAHSSTGKPVVFCRQTHKIAPEDDLQGLVGVKNEGRSVFIFYRLINIHTKI